jgi:multidrug resistance efflux pump
MELLLAGIYIAFCWLIFKIFRIPVNQWSLATATLGGLIGIVLLLLVMNYNHPFTTQARLYFTVTPILPGVRGRVTEVPVTPNVPLKQGDVLFKLDPRPLQYMVDQKKAQLAEAEQDVKQLNAALDKATAERERMTAQYQLAQENFDRQQQLFQKDVVSKATLDTFARNLETARQSVASATAGQEQARLASSSEIGGTNTTVARLQAELDTAEYDLGPTVTYAPGPGFVTQVALRPGVFTVPIPLTPVMVFVNTGPEDTGLVGAFQQNSLQRVSHGDSAEIAFDAVPGQVFHGEVISVLDALAAGQILPSGGVQDFKAGEGRALARIKITDDLSDYQIPLGSAAQVAILTHHFHHIALLRRILLRMKSWQNYVFMEPHGGGGGAGH